MVKKTAIFIFSLYGFLVFIALMFLLLPLFIIAFLLPSPYNGNLVYKLSRFWGRTFFLMTGIHYVALSETELKDDGVYIFVCNHISYMDIPMMMLVTSGRSVRILGKAEMGRIPVFGFIYKMGTVSVKRNNPEERKESMNKLKEFISQKISILICPEGTFNMTGKPLKEFYDGAFKIAIEMQKPVVPIIFPDTYDRMFYRNFFSLTPGKSRAIIMSPIATKGKTPADLSQLKDEVYSKMNDKIVSLNATWIKKRS